MEQLVNFIIRPPRAEYDPSNDLLEQEFMLRGKWYQRKDLEVKNSRGDLLQCSHYVPIVSPDGKPMPCVIYCHGNSGCRADASEAAIILLPSNITVFTLDFSGSGLSGGEHVTLGWNEKDDLKAVVDFLRSDGNVSMIGLWGRSMGAVTSLMYGAEDPSIAGMVLDSPFSDLVDLMMELVDTYKVRLPKFTVKFAIQFMRRSIQKKAKFDITSLSTVKVAKTCFVPALFGHATDDDFINPHHSDRIYEAYMGDKNIIKFEGDHNSPRPQFYFDSINIFFHNVLQPPADEVGVAFFDPMQDYFGKAGWRTAHQVNNNHDPELPTPSTEHANGSTEEDISRLRSRRQMSRMEVPTDISSNDDQSKTKVKRGDNDLCSSSSNMISFDFTNGSPCGPHVPTAMEDDQYLEYELDDLAGFPSDVEEEERMFMEAILLSLKDLETRPKDLETRPMKSEAEEKKLPTIEELDSSKTHQKDDHSQADSSSMVYEVVVSKTEPETEPKPKLTSTITEQCVVTKSEFSSVSKNDSDRREPSSSSEPPESDLSANTKATLTVERNPSSNVMDGLMRRWDFGFFSKQSK